MNRRWNHTKRNQGGSSRVCVASSLPPFDFVRNASRSPCAWQRPDRIPARQCFVTCSRLTKGSRLVYHDPQHVILSDANKTTCLNPFNRHCLSNRSTRPSLSEGGEKQKSLVLRRHQSPSTTPWITQSAHHVDSQKKINDGVIRKTPPKKPKRDKKHTTTLPLLEHET